VEKNGKQKYLLIKTFFVINEEEYAEYTYITRKNIMALVHYGFSREELYYMPLTEFLDYIKILNDETIAATNTNNTNQSSNENDVKMAGNTIRNFL
jgi:hypothetical protein